MTAVIANLLLSLVDTVICNFGSKILRIKTGRIQNIAVWLLLSIYKVCRRTGIKALNCRRHS